MGLKTPKFTVLLESYKVTLNRAETGTLVEVTPKDSPDKLVVKVVPEPE